MIRDPLFLRLKKYALLCLLPAACTPSGRQGTETADTSAAAPDSVFISRAFAAADTFMNTDHYDSAQIWLNRIHEKLSYRKPSRFSYFLTVRQAEVYYYNNLHQLGLQEAQRALTLAEQLADPILQADALNFCGLFFTNMGRTEQGIRCFKKGIAFSRQPPYPAGYPELSNPHHLYGNLAEAFEKAGAHDSARVYAQISLQKAATIRNLRGMSAACLNLGIIFQHKNEPDSSRSYFQQALQYARQGRDFDIELNALGGLARCDFDKGHREEPVTMLLNGFALLEKHPQLNNFYALNFLEQAREIFKADGQTEALATALEMKSDIQTRMHQKNNRQYRLLLLAGLRNETRIMELEIAEALHEKSLATTRLYILVLVFLLLAAAFFVYRYYVLQKLKLAGIRNKISQDLHDEVGATLSGIALYSYITREQNKRAAYGEADESLGIIEKNATGMVKKLSDIVWAVNPAHDSFASFMQRMEEYALEHCRARGIECVFVRQDRLGSLSLPMEQRKNIYLICKEALNNAIKYSGCTRLEVRAEVRDRQLEIRILDNGRGFDPEAAASGNGIGNMQSRAREMKARLEIKSAAGKGTEVCLRCKITR